VDAVVSIDVLQLVEDHAAMLREVARVIKPDRPDRVHNVGGPEGGTGALSA
jgi:ubiquinone/menaquinone biosynthesis C-methylase UbiE